MRQVGFIISILALSFSLHACTSAKFPLGKTHVSPQIQQVPVFKTSDGAELVMQVWKSAPKPRARVLLLHGFNEYTGAYETVGTSFAKRGIEVWAYDQRGFGRSPYRGLWSSAERMAQDAQEALRLIKQQDSKTPLYLLGMSMGGAVALYSAKQNGLPIKGVILVAPAVWAKATQPFYQRWALAFTRHVMPGWQPTGEGLNIKPTDNKAMLRKIWQSPWMLRESRIDTVAGLNDLMDKAYNTAAHVKYPTLLLYGAHDQLIPPKPIEHVRQHLPKFSHTEYKYYANGWHMLMRDLQGEQVIADISRWIQQTH
jgi:alpha-beta hydrolase superfamily lysophospholipase